MLDLVEIVKQVGYTLDIGYWMIDLDSRTVYWPRGLGRPHDVEGDKGYVASSLEKTLSMIEDPDQGRFRTFLADILKGQGEHPIEITFNASWGAKIRLRMAGRQVGHGKEARIMGLVEVIDRLKEAERLAKSMSFIVEALFISSDAGIVLFDNGLRVRRLNRNAMELFGVTEADEERGDWAEVIEQKLPKSVREALTEAIENSAAVSGTLNLGGLGGARLAWRANPWGNGVGDMSGLVMTVTSKVKTQPQVRTALLAERELLGAEKTPILLRDLHREPVEAPEPAALPVPVELPPAPKAAVDDPDGHRHRALEWVKHPIVLVSITTGEIVYANRAAREHLHLPHEGRVFVENMYDLSGFACDVDPLAITTAGGKVVRLRLGARVGRMTDYDADLLFVEYHEDVHRPIPQAAPRPAPPAAGRPAPPSPGRPSPVVGSHAAR